MPTDRRPTRPVPSLRRHVVHALATLAVLAAPLAAAVAHDAPPGPAQGPSQVEIEIVSHQGEIEIV